MDCAESWKEILSQLMDVEVHATILLGMIIGTAEFCRSRNIPECVEKAESRADAIKQLIAEIRAHAEVLQKHCNEEEYVQYIAKKAELFKAALVSF